MLWQWWWCSSGQRARFLFRSIPAVVYSFNSVNCLKSTTINKKEAGDDPFLKNYTMLVWSALWPIL